MDAQTPPSKSAQPVEQAGSVGPRREVRQGQSVTFTVDAYPGIEWKGKVESLSPATGAEFSILPPQNATGNWVKVVQRLPVRLAIEPDAAKPPLRMGMSAIVTIDTGEQGAAAQTPAPARR